MEDKLEKIKEFDYKIGVGNYSTIYDKDIRSVKDDYKIINSEIILYNKLIDLSNSEMEKAKDKIDYETLVNDKTYFINQLLKNKMILSAKREMLSKLIYKKHYLIQFIKNIKYYNENLNKINKVIKLYNDGIICTDNNDINIIRDFKRCLSIIINYDNSDININYDKPILRKYYRSLSEIDLYYTNKVVNNNLENDNNRYEHECKDFIFSYKVIDYNKDKRDDDDDVNLDYMIYCNQKTSKRIRHHKIRKIRKSSKWTEIRKSLKKNICRIVMGLLAGATMLGASTVTAGYNTSNKPSTMDSVSYQEIVNQVEDDTYKDESKKQNTVDNTKFNNKKNSKDEITIGTTVSASNDIYINATDAYNKTNKLKPYYSKDDIRKVELIYYTNDKGDNYLVSKENKDKIKELKELKYYVVAYCLNDGWYNKDDVKVLVK